ncbi:MAG: tellurite resistance TerB family protein [Hyphomicrobiaceae bacterium]
MDDIIRQFSGGRSPDQLLAELKKLIGDNQLASGAALGGLGALVLGTQSGRALAGSAAKLGALALIGGLAYKAYQNYQAGRPLISGPDAQIAPAPSGTGFEEAAATNDSALAYIRAMVAAAAADGRITPDEQSRIIGSLSEAGLDSEAEQFLADQLNAPASIASLVSGIRTEQEALQLYTAARLAIDPDTRAEQTFLNQLAAQLGIDESLARHIDATARQAVT